MQKQDQINVSEIERTLEGSIAGADQLRASALSGFAGVRRAKEKMLMREQVRLSLKLGPDHPRTLKVADRIVVNRGLHSEVLMEAERARTETPSANPGAWLLHGYVRESDGKAAPGLTIALYDRQGAWARSLGHACTDARGYFKLESGSIKDKSLADVCVHVLNSQGQHLYIDKSLLTPTAGQVDYREITLSGMAAVCTPPPCEGDKPPCEPQPFPDPDVWVVQGRISDADGRGLPDLIVSVYDKDLLFDDRLGDTETNQNGDYRLTYHTRDFCDLIERNPDLYLKITERSGKLCYWTDYAIRWNAGRTETINVVLPNRSQIA